MFASAVVFTGAIHRCSTCPIGILLIFFLFFNQFWEDVNEINMLKKWGMFVCVCVCVCVTPFSNFVPFTQ